MKWLRAAKLQTRPDPDIPYKCYGKQNHRIGETLANRLKDASKNSFGCAQSTTDALLIRQTVSHIQLMHEQTKTLVHEMESLVEEQDRMQQTY